MRECNLREGRAVGYIKKAIEEAILSGQIPNEYAAAHEFFITNKNRLLAEFSTQETK